MRGKQCAGALCVLTHTKNNKEHMHLRAVQVIG